MAGTPDALIRQWFEDLWNRGDESTIDRLLAPNATAHGLAAADQPHIGPDSFKSFYRQFHAGFPNIHIDVERTVTEGDTVVALCRCTGTHGGNFLGKAPTQNQIDFRGMAMVRVANGQFVEAWNTFDFLTCYQQIELMPQLAAQP